MLSLSIGPLALPLPPLVLLVSVGLAAFVANRLQGRPLWASGSQPDPAPGDALWLAALLGLAGARLVHVVAHGQAYLASPVHVLDVRDGGWHVPSGLACAGAWLAAHAWRVSRWRRALAVAALAGSLLWAALTWLTGSREGARMPALALAALGNDRAVTLGEVAAGRPAVVNLWASWCGPCREEMPVLAAAQAREAGIAFVFVNQGEPQTAVRSYLARLGLPLRDVLLDPGSSLLEAAGSRGLPTTLFYDAQGRLVDAHMGVLSEAALRVRLRALVRRP